MAGAPYSFLTKNLFEGALLCQYFCVLLNFPVKTEEHFIDFVVCSFMLILLSTTLSLPFPQTAQGGGHRTLLYGHAILLRHSYSGMVSRHLDFISCVAMLIQGQVDCLEF